MSRTLHNPDNFQRILKMTADTMLLVNSDGICVDIDVHSDLWFMTEERLLGKNIFDLLPEYTLQQLKPDFERVLNERVTLNKNYKIVLNEEKYYFKCVMHPYDDLVLCQYRDITKRSNVKRLLEHANHTLREIQKAAQIGQWIYNSYDNTFQYMGHTGILCKESVQSVTMSQYLTVVIEEDRTLFIDWWKRNRDTLTDESMNYRIRVDNSIHYIRIKTYSREVLPNGQFRLEGYIQNVTDIQHRRNDINTLTHAINNAKESIFAATQSGTLIFANRKFLENHSLSEDYADKNLKIYDIVANVESEQEWDERCREIIDGSNGSFVAYHPIKNNKSVVALEGMIYRVTNDSGEESFWSFAHDITDRMRYEAQIKRLNRIMDNTIGNLPAGIVVKDISDDFNYIYWNNEAHNRDSYIENPVGKNDYDFYPIEIAHQRREEDELVAKSGVGMHWTLEGKDKNGNLLILDKRKLRVNGDGLVSPIIISIEWDITELEMVKRELQASKEKAELSDKLKSAFLANMSHEIRTPLNAIVGFSQLIAESADADERRSFYEIVSSNNERLLQLINEILDLSKIESGIVEFTLGPVNLDSLCREVYDAHVFRTPLGVSLVYEDSDKHIVIVSDKNRVFQVISNLIGNAFKFTTQGAISYGYKMEDNMVVFHVTDTGMGIEPEKVGLVFDRFAKLNNFAQGTGLGLFICKTIVERLGGTISVVSMAGKGTTFTFTLPSEMTDNEDTDEHKVLEKTVETDGTTLNLPTTKPEGQKRATILIAEDTDNNYDLLNVILRSSYNLVRARDGMEAVYLFEHAKPDLILMDIKMPNLDGIEATRIIRELSPTIPIIMQSAYAYENDRQMSFEAGCNDFLAKPLSKDILKATIRKWLGETENSG